MRRFSFVLSWTLLAFTARAQVTNFSEFKVTVYNQSSAAAPTQPDHPNAYYFGAQLNFTDGAQGIADVAISGPVLPFTYLTEGTPIYYSYGSPYYDLKMNFDSDFPAGEYDFQVDYTNYSDYGALFIPDYDFYSTNIAAFTPDCWTAMQQVDPSQDFTLTWNAFTPDTNTTSAFTFVDFYDDDTGSNVFSADFLTPDTTTTNIPADTLLYGKLYDVNTFFSDRQDTPDAGFGSALGTVGFDNLTHTTLMTIQPWLRIAQAPNTNVTLTWPTLASNYVLESVDQLPAPGSWTTVTNIYTPSGGTNFLTLPATGLSRFFRLRELTPAL
jgi:hypothetical protein